MGSVAVTTLVGHEIWFVGNKVFMTQFDIGRVMCDGDSPTVLHDNEYYTANGTVTECGMPLKDWQAAGHDSGSRVAVIPDDNTILGLGAEKLGIKSHLSMTFII